MTDWALVPRKPTEEMLGAVDGVMRLGDRTAANVWSAMIAASPASPLQGDRVADLEAGEPCAFVDCPPGLFRYAGMLCFKSEYSSKAGQQDAYVIESGEYFWGGTNGDLSARRALVVTPMSALSPQTQSSDEGKSV